MFDILWGRVDYQERRVGKLNLVCIFCTSRQNYLVGSLCSMVQSKRKSTTEMQGWRHRASTCNMSRVLEATLNFAGGGWYLCGYPACNRI